MSKMVKAAQINDLSPGQGKVVEVEGQSIALFNVDIRYPQAEGFGPQKEMAIRG